MPRPPPATHAPPHSDCAWACHLGRICVAALFSCFLTTLVVASGTFDESLVILPMFSSEIAFALEFNVKATSPVGGTTLHDLFPRVLAQTLEAHDVPYIDLSLTQGRWLHERPEWARVGALISKISKDPMSPPGPPGAHLATTIERAKWPALANALEGLTCSSLAQLLTPQLGYGGPVAPKSKSRYSAQVSRDSGTRSRPLLVAHLQREPICTENLTPWMKLVPGSSGARGLVSLLSSNSSYRVLGRSSSYISLRLRLSRNCDAKNNMCHMSMTLGLLSVSDTSRYLNRHYSASNSVLAWGLNTLFGNKHIAAPPPFASSSAVKVVLPAELSHLSAHLSVAPHDVKNLGEDAVVMYYDVRKSKGMENLKFTPPRPLYDTLAKEFVTRPVFFVHRTIVDFSERGGRLLVDFINPTNTSRAVTYADSAPWFLSVFFHTAQLSCHEIVDEDAQDAAEAVAHAPPHSVSFKHAVDGKHPTTYEVGFRLAESMRCVFSVNFELTIRPRDDFRAEVFRGVELGSASVFATDVATGVEQVIYTDALAVILPSPDGSMPYNAIMLTCTFLAIHFSVVFAATLQRVYTFVQTDSRGKTYKILPKDASTAFEFELPEKIKGNDEDEEDDEDGEDDEDEEEEDDDDDDDDDGEDDDEDDDEK